jgi:hypothetical protein
MAGGNATQYDKSQQRQCPGRDLRRRASSIPIEQEGGMGPKAYLQVLDPQV